MCFAGLPAGTAAGSPAGKRGCFQVIDTQTLYDIDHLPHLPSFCLVFDLGQSGIEPVDISRHCGAVYVGKLAVEQLVPYCAAAGYTADGLSALTVYYFEGDISRCRTTGGWQGRIRTGNLPLCLQAFFPK